MFKFLSGSGGTKKEDSKKKASALGIDPALFEDPKFDEEEPELDMPQESMNYPKIDHKSFKLNHIKFSCGCHCINERCGQ